MKQVTVVSSEQKQQIWSHGVRYYWTNVIKLFRLHPLELKEHSDVPPFCRERHIYFGYRPNPNSVSYCIKSILHPTNETMNFWTHFLPFLFLVVRHHNLANTLDWTSQKVATVSSPFWAYSLGTCLLLLCSSMAHLFNCISSQIRHLCFCVDYGAISVYSIAATLAYFYLVSPPHCHGFNYDMTRLYIPISAGTVILSHILCCHTRFPHVKFRYLLRTLTYATPFVLISAPTIVRMSEHIFQNQMNGTLLMESDNCAVDTSSNRYGPSSTCISQNPQNDHCGLGNVVFTSYYPLHILFFLIAAVVNVSRFPEGYYPRKFDIIGSSHQLFHIAIALGIIVQSFIVEEALFDAIRRPGLPHSSLWLSTVNTQTTMGWMTFVTLFLSVVVLVYSHILPC